MTSLRRHVGVEALAAGGFAVRLAVVEEEGAVRVEPGGRHGLVDAWGGFLDADLEREEGLFEEVGHAQAFVAEERLLGHAPVDGVRVAEQEEAVAPFEAQQAVEAFRGYPHEELLKGLDDVGVLHVGQAGHLPHRVAEFGHRGAAAFEAGEDALLSEVAQERAGVEPQFLKGAEAAFAVEVDQHAAEVEKQVGDVHVVGVVGRDAVSASAV